MTWEKQVGRRSGRRRMEMVGWNDVIIEDDGIHKGKNKGQKEIKTLTWCLTL